MKTSWLALGCGEVMQRRLLVREQDESKFGWRCRRRRRFAGGFSLSRVGLSDRDETVMVMLMLITG